MEYCAPRALPHTAFLSWSEDDQDKALAWLIHDRSKCPQCGTHPDDWIDSATGRALEPPPFMADAKRCWGCVTLSDSRERDEGIIGQLHYLTPWKEVTRDERIR